jgi:protease-4
MKKRAMIITICVVVVVAAILVPLILLSGPAKGKIAVIPLSGTITSGGSSLLSSSTITPDLVRSYLSRAENDRAVKAIVLRIDSPGGEVEASQEILLQIERARESKPIVVSMGSMAASGGYYISTGANEIVALPTTETGSIGVISYQMNVQGFLDKLGIDVQVFKGGKYKDMYTGFRELTPEEQSIMQATVDEFYEQFVGVVAEGRGLSTDQVRDLATGQLYSGTEAKELGLIDELGDLDAALSLAAGLAGIEAAEAEYYHGPGLISRLLSGLVSAVQTRISGLSAEDMIALQILNHNYPQPLFLYQS